MTEWITQEDWSTLKVGDQVRVRTDDGDELKGYVEFVFNGHDDDVHRIHLSVPTLPESAEIRDSEWFLSVPAKPAVQLPTEPGWYLAWDKLANAPFPVEVSATGTILFARAGRISSKLGDPERFAPFTKLEPVAVTAKKFVEAYRAYSSGTNRTVYLLDQAVLEVARKEFGADE